MVIQVLFVPEPWLLIVLFLGFTLSLKEYESTIATLWKTTKEFIKEHPEHLAEDNSMSFVSEDNGHSYNLCHFVSLLYSLHHLLSLKYML